jgi:hypothetical protein
MLATAITEDTVPRDIIAWACPNGCTVLLKRSGFVDRACPQAYSDSVEARSDTKYAALAIGKIDR